MGRTRQMHRGAAGRHRTRHYAAQIQRRCGIHDSKQTTVGILTAADDVVLQQRLMVTPWNEVHAAVFNVGRIERDPELQNPAAATRISLRTERHLRVRHVLMPRRFGRMPRWFEQKLIEREHRLGAVEHDPGDVARRIARRVRSERRVCRARQNDLPGDVTEPTIALGRDLSRQDLIVGLAQLADDRGGNQRIERNKTV